MVASSSIRRHINMLADNELFKNRDLLVYAKRALVDWVLYQLCKAGDIVREARGVYRKQSFKFRPSIDEIARFKANAFGRRLVSEFRKCAADAGLLDAQSANSGEEGAAEYSFVIDGASSSFATTGGTRIYLKNKSARKVGLQDQDRAQAAIKALWHLGKPLRPVMLAIVTRFFGRTDNQAFRNCAPLMPGWMADATKGDSGKYLSRKEREQQRREDERLEQQRGFAEFRAAYLEKPQLTDNHGAPGAGPLAAEKPGMDVAGSEELDPVSSEGLEPVSSEELDPVRSDDYDDDPETMLCRLCEHGLDARTCDGESHFED